MNEVVILLTLNCNIRCNYCFFEKTKTDITIEKITKILKWFISGDGDEKRITLLGGEPLLLFNLIKETPSIINKANFYNKRVYFKDIHTNGTLLNKDMIKFFKTHNMTLAFSFDGYGYDSNHNRFNGNKVLYRQAIHNLKMYSHFIGTPKIKMTIVPENAQNLYENVKSFIVNGFCAIEINPACGYPWSKRSVDLFCADFRRVIELYKALKNSGRRIFINPIDRYLKQSEQECWNTSDCGLGEKVVFTPNGDAFACSLAMHMKDEIKNQFYLGNINTGIDLQKMNKFKDSNPCIEKEISCKCRFSQLDTDHSFVNFKDSKASTPK